MPNTPVNVIVNSSKAPARISAFSDSFTVVNSSATSTVWIGDDPSVRTGTGIRLAPLASCHRMAGVETYVILDTASTDPASLLLSFSIDQYQDPYSVALALQNSGLILVDSPVMVVPSTVIGPGTTQLPSATSLYDVRTLQSVYVTYTTNIGTAAHTATVTLTWYANITALPTEQVGSDRFGWANTDVWPLVGRQLAVRGSYLRVQVDIAGAGASDTLAVVGSHRPVSPPSGANVLDRVLASGQNAAVAAGGSLTLTPSIRYDGPAMLSVAALQGAAPDGVEINVTDLTLGFTIGYAVPLSVTQTGGFIRTALSFPVVLPRNSYNIAIRNSSAAARFVQATLIAAPEGT